MERGIIEAMNNSFSTPFSTTGRWLNGLLAKLGRGTCRLLQSFDSGRGRFPEVEIAAQKRLLEKRLLANGYSRKLALIAVATAFAEPAKPE